MSSNKHENYELLNLIGYGLAKFDRNFIAQFGFKSKTAFYEFIISKEVASTYGTIKNRQDLFDPFFDNGRKGWWQRGNTYIHRKIYIDSMFGSLDVKSFAEVVEFYLDEESKLPIKNKKAIKPILKSKFKQLQITGHAAEQFFIQNFHEITLFKNGSLEDARYLGDGYDFQVQVDSDYYLAEVKGLQSENGAVRLTKNEFLKAREYKNEYALVVISNLYEAPNITTILDPLSEIEFSKNISTQEQIYYNSKSIQW